MSDATRYAILGILNTKKMSGYQIKKELEKTISVFWTDSFAQLYPMLHQLEKNKLIELDSYQSHGKRVSKIYNITAAGTDSLKEWLKQPASELRVRDELLLKVFMGSNIEESFSLEKVKSEELRLQGMQGCLNRAKKGLVQEEVSENSFHKLTIDYIEGVVNAKLNWCNRAKTILQGD